MRLQERLLNGVLSIGGPAQAAQAVPPDPLRVAAIERLGCDDRPRRGVLNGCDGRPPDSTNGDD
jgi:hypothetical protein